MIKQIGLCLKMIFISCIAQQLWANTASSPEQIQLQKDNQTFKNYIPQSYVLFDTARGDLNKDGLEDIVLIIKATNPQAWVNDEYKGKLDRNRRGIIVLLANKDQKSYKTLLKNLNCFSSDQEEGGVYFAPELYPEIKKGLLELNYGHGRYGYWGYKFRIEQNDMRLIGYDHSSNRGPMVESFTSINLLTGKKLYKDNLNKHEPEKTERFKEIWSTVKIAPIYLSKINDFDEFELE